MRNFTYIEGTEIRILVDYIHLVKVAILTDDYSISTRFFRISINNTKSTGYEAAGVRFGKNMLSASLMGFTDMDLVPPKF